MNASVNRTAGLVTIGVALVGAIGLGLILGHFGFAGGVAIPTALAAVAVLIHPLTGLLGVIAGIPVEAAFVFAGGTVGKALAALVALAWFTRALLRGESLRHIVSSPLVIALLVFVGFRLTSAAWAVVPVAGLGGFVSAALLLALGVLTAVLVRSWDHVAWVARALVFGATAAAVLTVAQYLGGGVRRAGGDIGGGINTTAIVLVSVLPFAFYLIRRGRALWWRVLGAVYLVLGTVAVTLTFSRMAMLTLPLVAFIEILEISRWGRGRAIVAGIIGAAVIAIPAFVPLDKMTQRVESIVPYVEQTFQRGSAGNGTLSGRGYHIRVALEIFADHPIVGAGYNAYGPLFLRYQHDVPGADLLYRTPRSAHGTVWAVLANQGLVGFALLLTVFFVGARSIWNTAKRVRRWGRTSREFLLVRAIGLSAGLQAMYGLYSEVDVDKLIWILVGLVVVVSKLATAGRLRRRGSPPARVAETPLLAVGASPTTSQSIPDRLMTNRRAVSPW